MKLTALLFMLFPVVVFAQTYTVDTVPNTKLDNNSYVSNPNDIINSNTVAGIDSILIKLEKKATAQVSVVLLQSIGDADVFDFAQELFNKWGIGQKGNSNGLLILFVMDKRTVRFHTGDGLEGVLPDATCKRIQREYMVPYFKENNYDEGMLHGVEAVADVLNNPNAVAEITDTSSKEVKDYEYYALIMFVLLPVVIISFFVARSRKRFRVSQEANWIGLSVFRWLVLYVFLPYALLIIAFTSQWEFPLFALAIYGYIIFLLIERRLRIHSLAKPHIKANGNQWLWNFYKPQSGGLIFASILFPIPMLPLYFLYKKNLNRYRDLPRKCKSCGGVSKKLSEAEEDSFLKAGQIAEEKVGSIDYDVWKCTSCATTELLSYPNNNTKYTACPKCHAITWHLSKERTIKRATYSDYGSREEVRFCESCSHKLVQTFTIPILVASTSSDSGSSSSSSSSSSSGGSWGGGSSSGGGASSSW